jgi:hypothetical protein
MSTPDPGKFRGGGGGTGPDQAGFSRGGFLGIRHNEGATKFTGARARPEPRAARPEPPDHRARVSTRAARSFEGLLFSKAWGD